MYMCICNIYTCICSFYCRLGLLMLLPQLHPLLRLKTMLIWDCYHSSLWTGLLYCLISGHHRLNYLKRKWRYIFICVFTCQYFFQPLFFFFFFLSLFPSLTLSPLSLSLSLSPLPFLCPSSLSLQLVTLYFEAYYSCYDKTEREKLTQVRITYCVCVYTVLCTEYME